MQFITKWIFQYERYIIGHAELEVRLEIKNTSLPHLHSCHI